MRLADARKVIAATRVTRYHRISWVELPELLEMIDRFERQRLAERSSLIALRLMMLTLVRPSELREDRWSEVDIKGRQWIIPAESGRSHPDAGGGQNRRCEDR